MTIHSHDNHVLLGAFILGGLSDEDAQDFRDHLQSCPDCRQELDRLAGLPRLLELLRHSQPGRLAPL
jgi:anti-sigma factor RsiW